MGLTPGLWPSHTKYAPTSKSKISLTWDCTQPTDMSEANLQYTVHVTPGHKLMYLHIQNYYICYNHTKFEQSGQMWHLNKVNVIVKSLLGTNAVSR